MGALHDCMKKTTSVSLSQHGSIHKSSAHDQRPEALSGRLREATPQSSTKKESVLIICDFGLDQETQMPKGVSAYLDIFV